MVAEATVQRYRDAAIALLPPGRAYTKEPDSNLGELLEALMVEFARIHEDAAALKSNRTPARAVEYIADWEEALGLPGTCVTSPSTVISERQGAAVAKLLGRTSHAQAAYETAASALGYDDVSFVTFPPFSCDGDCEQSVYGDEWANVVRAYVAEGDQQARAELTCTFVDQLRRSHGFIDIVLEGPMGAERFATPNYYNNTSLSASGTVSALSAVSVRYSGHVSIQCKIDNGAGAAPSDTPVGVWELYVSNNGILFTRFSNATVDAELSKIKPNGNNVVETWAILEGVPGTSLKLRYNRTSGGGTNARATVHISTW